MKENLYFRIICTWSLGFLCFCSLPAGASEPVFHAPIEILSPSQQEIFQSLTQANVIYLGEIHDRESDHQAQLEILTKLYQENPQIAIALEMFQRSFQNVLDQYIVGEISEAELIAQTEYEQRWGFDWDLYAPIIRFAKENKLPLVALNTPTEITRQVAREGLDNLSPEQQEHIPPEAEIDLDSPEYRQMMREVYEMHAHGEHGNNTDFENFFSTQVLWDETMAEKIAQFLELNPNYQVIVLAGRGHIAYGYGIPDRVLRRVNITNFKQRSVFFPSSEEEVMEKDIADYIWE